MGGGVFGYVIRYVQFYVFSFWEKETDKEREFYNFVGYFTLDICVHNLGKSVSRWLSLTMAEAIQSCIQ